MAYNRKQHKISPVRIQKLLDKITNNDDNAMLILGEYYEDKDNYIEMMKYYQMAIERGNSNAMNNLGEYYEGEKNYNMMKKYYLMAIEKGNINAVNNLREYTEKMDRKQELKTELSNKGLVLRNDSVLCDEYIEGTSENSLEYIVQKMCEMKYLYEYCNMKACKKKARRDADMHYYYPGMITDLATSMALNKYSNGVFPDVFPWLKIDQESGLLNETHPDVDIFPWLS